MRRNQKGADHESTASSSSAHRRNFEIEIRRSQCWSGTEPADWDTKGAVEVWDP